MMWLRKSKKGFTLIELMVVVAIIGVLALLGLRVYTGQQEKAKNAIVIANASTVHTLIQGDMLDNDYENDGVARDGTLGVLLSIKGDGDGTASALTELANMKNPFGNDNIVILTGSGIDLDTYVGTAGEVAVYWKSPNEFEIQGIGAGPSPTGSVMTAQK